MKSRISVKRSASQVARATGAVIGKGLFRERVKFTGARGSLDRQNIAFTRETENARSAD
jgi:hypothetical protein